MPDVCRLLLVEDNPADVQLLTIACSDAGLAVDIKTIADGESAIRYVGSGDSFSPDLIIIDLNLPRISGHEVLEAARKNPTFENVPVLVLTTSRAPHDRERARSLGANEVLFKPNDFDEFCHLVQSAIKRFCAA